MPESLTNLDYFLLRKQLLTQVTINLMQMKLIEIENRLMWYTCIVFLNRAILTTWVRTLGRLFEYNETLDNTVSDYFVLGK